MTPEPATGAMLMLGFMAMFANGAGEGRTRPANAERLPRRTPKPGSGRAVDECSSAILWLFAQAPDQGDARTYGSVMTIGSFTSSPFPFLTTIGSNDIGVTFIVLPSISTTRKWFCCAHAGNVGAPHRPLNIPRSKFAPGAAGDKADPMTDLIRSSLIWKLCSCPLNTTFTPESLNSFSQC